METKTVIVVAGIQCRSEDEGKFNTWLNKTHIPALLKFRGLNKVTRYKIAKRAEGYPIYLTIYEFSSGKAYEAYETSPERANALAEMAETWKEGEVEVKWRAAYALMKTWEI